MEIVVKANNAVLSILGTSKKGDGKFRLFTYIAEEKNENGFLLFNLLTRELIFLEKHEYKNASENEYLREHWFFVSEELDDKKYADAVRWVCESLAPKTESITNFTILTTTDCNARCFYCYEKDCEKVKMSDETAFDVVKYIEKHHGAQKINLMWFGGEPLYNMSVIDLITERLQKSDIAFSSDMISNGYLFDKATVRRAKEKWKLRSVQITLDGTEKVYNRIKAYVNNGESAYRRVIENIGYLLDAEIYVNVRMNMDLYNSENLEALCDELAKRFDKKYIRVNVRHIFDPTKTNAEVHTDEEWEKRYIAKCRIEDKLLGYGLLHSGRINRKVKIHSCMADSDDSVIIHPTGKICACEHYVNGEFIGDIATEELDEKAIESWKERVPEFDECKDCFFLPECIRLRKCTVGTICYPQERKEFLRGIKRRMLNEYKIWTEENN